MSQSKKQYEAIKNDPVRHAALRERHRLAEIARRKAHPGIDAKLMQQRREKIPFTRTQAKAHTAVHRAIKKGLLTKPDVCSRCGSRENVEGHHPSYKKGQWLVVVWLCAVCHKKEHCDD